ncbi:Zinc finger, RING-type [Sesbania bispinosa]|nr:Zinc finger, RING-type [Sesbania bispinosa]
MAMDPDIETKYAQNTKVMIGSAILLFIIILIVVLFRTYVYLCRRRRSRSVLSSHSLPTTTASKDECLDPSVLKSLPIFSYSSAIHRHLHDCAVCLSEFGDGDEFRVLPNCNHAFHSHCIDAWFASHSNCPLCRTAVQPAPVSSESEPFSVSVSGSEPGEGCSSFPEPVTCPRKPLSIIVELPREDGGSDPVPGENGFKCSLKRLCSV